VNSFEGYFREFVTEFGGELPKETHENKTADFVFRKYNVIAELKILEKDARVDHAKKLQNLLNEWIRRGSFLAFGRVQISLRKLRPELQTEWINLLLPPIESIIRDANRQIRSTKRACDLPSAKGIVLIANDGNFLHTEPADYLGLIARVLGKKTQEGGPRFTHIDGVIYFSYRVPVRNEAYPFWAPGYLSLDPRVREFQDDLQTGWFAHLHRRRDCRCRWLFVPSSSLDQPSKNGGANVRARAFRGNPHAEQPTHLQLYQRVPVPQREELVAVVRG
jgi:hypothetical protein